MIQFYHFEKGTMNKQIRALETFFQRSVNQSDQLRILAAVESSFKHHFCKQKKIQIKKFSALKDLHQAITTPKAIYGSEKSVHNLS
jgi:hypothetical protein